MRFMKKCGVLFTAAVLTLGMSTAIMAEEASARAAFTLGTNAGETDYEVEVTFSLGTKAGETDYEVEVTNSTGETIVSAAIRVDGGEYGEELLPDGELFEDGETAVLYCTPKELEPGATSAPRYDIFLKFEDGEVAVIHTFPFGDADEAEILMDSEEADTEGEEADTEGETEEIPEENETEEADENAQTIVAYLKFTSKSLGSEQNTCQHERDTLNPPAVDYSAYTDYSYSDYSYSDYSYSDYSYDSGSDVSYDAPVYSDGGDSDDQCGTDGILN